MTTKIALTNIADTALATLTGPKVTTIVYPGDDTATDTAGGQTINLTGSGFQSGCSVLVGSTAASVVTFISSTQISFTAPVQTAGTYVLYVINPDGGTAISIPGISYSGTPTWTTTAGSLGTAYETGAISATLTATGDAPITYTLVSGTLPTGSSLNSNGTLSGTAVATASATTYSFTIKATDAQNQDTNRAFSITINPDVVTWSTPANSTTYSVFKDSAIANVAMSATSASGGSITYTADTLPTGLSITGANIAGTPTVAASTTTTLTATSTSTRSATRTINWVVSVANDTFWKNTTLLLNGETTVTPFISDASTNSFPLTINGDTKPVLFNPYQEGYYSNFFDGTGDYLATPDNVAFTLGSNDFTFECWVYPTSITNGNNNILVQWGNGNAWIFRYVAAGRPQFSGAATNVTGTTTAVTINQWNHVAITRTSGTVRLFVNGVLDATTGTIGALTDGASQVTIGAYSDGTSEYVTGYISNLRLINGTSLYTTTFTPSTTPLTAIANTSLLTCQSNRFIDNSTNNFTITKAGDVSVSPNIPFTQNSSYSTYGSTYFDGTGDYLTTPSNATLAFGSGDFCLEFWIYTTAFGSTDSRPLGNNTSWAANAWSLHSDHGTANEKYTFWANNYNSGSAMLTSTSSVILNTWTHVAITRSGTSWRMFINGVQEGSTVTSSAALDGGSSDDMYIGGSGAANEYVTGYMSNVRVVKGTAVYTTTFTPSTTPLTAIANTSLLTLQYNGGANNKGIIDNSNFNNIITRNGNTSQGTFSPYSVTGWSNYFDGTDYLTISPNASVAFNTEDFTVEMWVYMSTDNTNRALIETRAVDLSVNGFVFAIEATGGRFLMVFSNSKLFTTTNSISLNVWTHVALTRTGTTMRCFINGVQGASVTNSQNYTNTAFTIGSGIYASSGFDGYISNLRIIKGTALYTTTFTPSTTPLTAIANTGLLICQSNRFIDNSPNSFTLTRTGDVSVQALDPFGSIPEAVPISYSNYFNNGTTEYLSLTTTVFQHTADFTYECWVYWNGTVPSDWPMIFDTRPSNTSQSTSIACNLNPSTYRLNFYLGGTNYYWGATALPSNSWVHIAVVRSSGTVKIYQNGVLGTDTASNSSTFSGATGMRIGANIGNMGYWPGYISNFRVTNTAVYTATFTPSTTPLTAIANTSLLTCQSTRMIDNSTNRFTITANGDVKPRQYNPFGYTAQTYTSYTPSLHGGSAYFDGTGDWLQGVASAQNTFNMNFTIELWVYANSLSGQMGMFCVNNASTSGSDGIAIYFETGNRMSFWVRGSGGATITTTTYTTGVWYHVALVRNGSTNTLYVDGVSRATNTDTPTSSYSPIIGVGRLYNDNSSYSLNGYLSDIRVTKGTAIYTSNFVPPSQTLTNYSTTYPASLLLNFNNGGIIDQHGTNVLETLGNAQLSTAVKKYNNASVYFDGTGDYLYGAPNLNYAMGSGDFTIEFWYYPISQNAAWNPNIMGTYNTTWAANKWAFHAPHSAAAGKYSFWVNNYANTPMLASTSNITNGAWIHIAITRSGSSWRMFLNGTIEATVTSSVALDGGTMASMDGFYIGANFYAAEGGRYINAYMDDLRITKGYARYTANFTAPTSALITR